MTASHISVERTAHRLRPDPRRVIAKLFIPGQETLIDGESRAGSVIDRVLSLDDDQTASALDEVLTLFGDRHPDLRALLLEHFSLVAHRIDTAEDISIERQLLVGACFTQECAVEAASVCNPSMVSHPDQRNLAEGELRFVMSLRAIGEGHRSVIEFRTGVIGASGQVFIDEPGTPILSARPERVRYRRDLFHRVLEEMGEDRSSAAFVLDALPDPFDDVELEHALRALRDQVVTRGDAAKTIARIKGIADANYHVAFGAESSISQRVLVPNTDSEVHGVEDARFVRFTNDFGAGTYFATYTAYDGSHIAPRLLATDDFRTFESTQLTGRASRNKGMALFPRRIGGRFVALARSDGENNSIVVSDDLTAWDEQTDLQRPHQPWNLVQLGNCGSPIETADGWLMLTHGVGAMRRYVIAAELLDLDDPTRVIAQLPEPLLSPADDERDGYVPNVVYSCGALLHGDHLVVPYGIGDANVGIARFSLSEILGRLDRSRIAV